VQKSPSLDWIRVAFLIMFIYVIMFIYIYNIEIVLERRNDKLYFTLH
jgi:hypothetical protein